MLEFYSKSSFTMDKQDNRRTKEEEPGFPISLNSDTPLSGGRIQKLIFLKYTERGAKYQCPKGIVFHATLLEDGTVQLSYP